MELSLNEISEKVIGCAYTVSNRMGSGFLEKVYENALSHELHKAGMKTEQQKRLTVHYDGVLVGEYIADLIIEDLVLVEIKSAKSLDSAHMAQCLNYLKATGLTLCLLINFGNPRVAIQRIANGA
ncbi:MAG: GxxExxY protein [Pseudomonadota bacterium]